MFYKKSNTFMSKTADYSYLKNGPEALFSSFAQGLLFSTDGVQVGISGKPASLTTGADIS